MFGRHAAFIGCIHSVDAVNLNVFTGWGLDNTIPVVNQDPPGFTLFSNLANEG